MREDASRIGAGNAPQAVAVVRNAMLRLVNPLSRPLPAIRESFAEDRFRAIETVEYGLL